MPHWPYPEVNPDENKAAESLYHLLKATALREEDLQPKQVPAAGSGFAVDAATAPTLPTKNAAQFMLSAGYGCLDALKHWLGIQEEQDSQGTYVNLTVRLHGGYPLLRNALECGASALWLMSPESSRARVKRQLLLHLDEVHNYEQFAKTAGLPIEHLAAKRQRVDQFAVAAGIAPWTPKHKASPKTPKGKKKPKQDALPRMTDILRKLDEERSDTLKDLLPWLAAWQLSSGFAHGKMWAATTGNDSVEQIGTRDTYGATFHFSTNLQKLNLITVATYELLETGFARYSTLLGELPSQSETRDGEFLEENGYG
ncbi:hypothetical protein [Nesterenkonia muleiensis]|uniref:hypothetical protein n=1 Tax=Nesterenkonia muleiensis TaxID=2282648 RepID=UPI000E73A302|nr:hypothetical protein [Nesterenkonia muleiensis]